MSTPGPDPPPPPAPGVAELLSAVSWLARLGWFALGALVASAVMLGISQRPWRKNPADDHPLPYETFPFSDNSGVCQEWVALATLQTSHPDAQGIVRRIAPSLPGDLRPENLRIVRAFGAGDVWTLAADAQPGIGDAERARAVATALNGMAGTGLHFEAQFYSQRRLYETARVLCMPRQSADPH